MSSADVVIVGGGSAGCVLASRLSEDPQRRVLLLEAGPDYLTLEATPAELQNGHTLVVSHDWGFVGAATSTGLQIKVPRPKVVGGSSATNATIALRGQPADYDGWEGWSFRELLPYFKKLETDHDFSDDAHGERGPMPIRRYRRDEWLSPHAAFLEAAQALGHADVQDHNAGNVVGAGSLPLNREGSTRQSTALTYLAAARGRPNLEVRAAAHVDRVLFEGRRAIGVELAGSGDRITAGAVVLSAGAYGSPLILMRSGVGGADALRALGIAAVQDLPSVGAGLADHALWAMHFATQRPAAMPSTSQYLTPQFQSMLTLRLTSAAGVDAQIFPSSTMPVSILRAASGGVFSLNVSAMRPSSRGDVRLTARDPFAPPAIEFAYFTAPDDMPTLLSAIAEARRLVATPPLAKLALAELSPGTQAQTAADLEAHVRRTVTTYHHACGSCRMGPSTSAGAVVNTRGEVHGLERLWVFDASIMPSIPSANIHLSTLAIAERGADLLRA